jgi:hypothetical protein
MDKNLITSLNIDRYDKKMILNVPADVSDFKGIDFNNLFCAGKYDFVFAFIFSLDEFVHLLETIIDNDVLNNNAAIFFSYPKRNNKKYGINIGREDFFRAANIDETGYIGKTSLKFDKTIAFNKKFTAVGFKYQIKKKSKPAQIVAPIDDFIERIPEIREYLGKNEDALQLFDSLTMGYQREWARQLFGAENNSKINKRYKDMHTILKKGYKSMDAYRRRIKSEDLNLLFDMPKIEIPHIELEDKELEDYQYQYDQMTDTYN